MGRFADDGGHTGLGVGIKAGRNFGEGEIIHGLSAIVVKRPATAVEEHYNWCEWSWMAINSSGGGSGALRGPLSFVNHGCQPTQNVVYKGLGSRPATSTLIGVKTRKPVMAGEELLVSYSPAMTCLCPRCRD